MKLPKLVIFDLDGTLVDSSPDLCASLNHVLLELGRSPIDASTVRHLVGHGARVLIERGLALTGGASEAEVVRGVPLFLTHYAAHIADGTRAFEGVEDVFDALTAAGTVLAICTNKPQALSDALVTALGWNRRFAAVVGADSVPARKPDAGHVRATAAAAGVDLADAVFIGDTNVDVGAARAAGVPVIVVGFGFADDARDLGADRVIDHYSELLPALSELAR